MQPPFLTGSWGDSVASGMGVGGSEEWREMLECLCLSWLDSQPCLEAMTAQKRMSKGVPVTIELD